MLFPHQCMAQESYQGAKRLPVVGTKSQKRSVDEPHGAVFLGREPTGEISDWILSRILWLRGLEEGFNLGHGEPLHLHPRHT
jgi:hypothetical protein